MIIHTRAALVIGLGFAFCSGIARADTVLDRAGTWQLVKMEPSFDLTVEACVVVSTSKISGGRRERSQIRIIPVQRKIFVDPDIFLSGVVTALAVIADRSDRQLPERRTLLHSMKIDDGPVVNASEANPSYGKWELTRSLRSYKDFVASLSEGRFLHYQWKLDRAEKYHRYDLTGLSTLLEQAENSADCMSSP